MSVGVSVSVSVRVNLRLRVSVSVCCVSVPLIVWYSVFRVYVYMLCGQCICVCAYII